MAILPWSVFMFPGLLCSYPSGIGARVVREMTYFTGWDIERVLMPYELWPRIDRFVPFLRVGARFRHFGHH